MMTRSRRQQVRTLLEGFRLERMLRQQDPVEEKTESQLDAREARKMERELRRQRNLWTTRRILRPGETKRIVELRFGAVGSLEPTAMSYSLISKRLFIKRATVVSVCHAYQLR